MPALVDMFTEKGGWVHSTLNWHGDKSKAVLTASGLALSHILLIECDKSDSFTTIRRIDVKGSLAESPDIEYLVETIVAALDQEEKSMLPAVKIAEGAPFIGSIGYEDRAIGSIAITHFDYAVPN